eukprot:SAG31_NODE_155_length_22130_cov_9.540098_20_plen_502_part_00
MQTAGKAQHGLAMAVPAAGERGDSLVHLHFSPGVRSTFPLSPWFQPMHMSSMYAVIRYAGSFVTASRDAEGITSSRVSASAKGSASIARPTPSTTRLSAAALSAPQHVVAALHYDGSSERLASLGRDGLVRLWDARRAVSDSHDGFIGRECRLASFLVDKKREDAAHRFVRLAGRRLLVGVTDISGFAARVSLIDIDGGTHNNHRPSAMMTADAPAVGGFLGGETLATAARWPETTAVLGVDGRVVFFDVPLDTSSCHLQTRASIDIAIPNAAITDVIPYTLDADPAAMVAVSTASQTAIYRVCAAAPAGSDRVFSTQTGAMFQSKLAEVRSSRLLATTIGESTLCLLDPRAERAAQMIGWPAPIDAMFAPPSSLPVLCVAPRTGGVQIVDLRKPLSTQTDGHFLVSPQSGLVSTLSGDDTIVAACRGGDTLVCAFDYGENCGAGAVTAKGENRGLESKKKNKHKRGGRRRADEHGKEPAISRSDAAARRRFPKKNNRRKQ